MTRKKVKLVWIVSDSARKASFKKRRVGLLKKVSELTTLCGVSALVIVYGPDDQEPAVWPSRPVVQQLLARFQNMPDMERGRKMMNQETYLKERTIKVQDQLRKHHRKSKEMEVAHLMHQVCQGRCLDDFDITELRGLVWLVEEKVKEIRKRMEYFHQVPPILPGGPFTPQEPAVDEMGRTGGTNVEGRTPMEALLFDQWFLDMMNNKENNIASNSSTVLRNDMGLQPHGNIGGGGGSGGSSTIGPFGGLDMGLQHHGNICNSIAGLDMGLRPPANAGFGSGASDSGLPHGLFGGSSGASDAGLPFEINKNWFFSP